MTEREEDVISLDDEEETNIPDVATCQALVEQFASITNTDEACAQFYLQDRDWNLERSVNAFFEARTGGIKVLNDGDEPEVVVTFDSNLVSVLAGGTLSEEAPKNFRFITWNVDGLDDKHLKKRTKTIARIIEKESADIVFIQELVPKTYSYLEDLLPQFVFVVGDTKEYFTAILLRRTTVYFDGHNLIPFTNTCMGRNLLCVEAHIGDVKLNLMNSHLESTADYSKERTEQLKIGFDKMKSCSPNSNVIFGGDLNLRDKEVISAGLPSNCFDLWEACGRRPECKWTWDTERNTNKQFPGRYKPKTRFDRVYLRPSDPPIITPRHFGLLGLEKTSGTQSFPSDHWGVLIHFEVTGKADKKSKACSSDTPSTSQGSHRLKQ
ncbi:tyrosyl-DNA phosphodiesterase 2 [Procambarus clarkii]|uniref:tyrosyl-DNA phosphodiesterase 2 n=1 Tax=Procambarus clarkii TaxID=6728 RepID=UPI001E6743F8|nr:tyrosyl-DNA phosphodiesterase 2-like [Procambarus clarkii]XP_045610572.1 tyrosyl-DNA phosphodiesterase 2-like [Procambarus clarkii]